MAEFDSIIYEKVDGRVRLTLNRPEKLNAITLRMMEQLNEALWEADNDRDVHCVIVKGAGRAFCSGYDLRGDDSSGSDHRGIPRRCGISRSPVVGAGPARGRGTPEATGSSFRAPTVG